MNVQFLTSNEHAMFGRGYCSDIVSYTATLTSPDRALIDPPPKMSWAKKALLFAALIKKPFLTQLIFGGGSISSRSGLVKVAI